MIGTRAFLSAVALAALGAPALAQSSAQSDAVVSEDESSTRMIAGVAATVNDEMISVSDVAQRARLLLITIGLPPSGENLQQAIPRALEELIDERLQLQKAGEYELEVAEADIEAAVRDIAAQNQSTLDQLYATLNAAGINPDTLKEQMRAEIAWRRIMGGLYGSRIRISPLQIDDFLKRLSDTATETRYQLSEIFLYAPTEADKEKVLQGANVIFQQLQQGAQFQLAAQQYSNSPTAAVGGDLGVVSVAELEPEVLAVLETTTPPAITPPIVTQKGVYLYAVRGRQDGSTGAMDVDLRQVISLDDDRTALSTLSFDAPACSELETASEASGLVYADLGRIAETDLTTEVQNAISGIPAGGISGIIETANGPAILFVCDRGQTGLNLPTRQQIEDRLYSQQLALNSDRELRDLKREATIIRR